ncbi:hypothetical protein B0H16DRAFT_1465448 [Mycena metata]|uniref:Uncharacterized protein n=1 Tax=Mycena metata TaxID=1033252 RepID=A0AAD7IB86_9AGAR|nr:hypothetical protein B0H16DRAFT_1465448 [Mycena metata]
MNTLLRLAQGLKSFNPSMPSNIPPAFQAWLSDPNVLKEPLDSNLRLKFYFTETYLHPDKSVDAINKWLLDNAQLIGHDMKRLFTEAEEKGDDDLRALKETTFIIITPEGVFNGVDSVVPVDGPGDDTVPVRTHDISKAVYRPEEVLKIRSTAHQIAQSLKLFGAPVYTFINTIAFRMNESGDHVVDSAQRKQIDNTNFLSNGVFGFELLKEKMSSIDGLNAQEHFTAEYLSAPNVKMGKFLARLGICLDATRPLITGSYSPYVYLYSSNGFPAWYETMLKNPNALVAVCDTDVSRGGVFKLAPIEDGIFKRGAAVVTQFLFGMQAKANEQEKPAQIAYEMKDIANRQILENTKTGLRVRVSDFLHLPFKADNFNDVDVQRMDYSSLLPDYSKKPGTDASTKPEGNHGEIIDHSDRGEGKPEDHPELDHVGEHHSVVKPKQRRDARLGSHPSLLHSLTHPLGDRAHMGLNYLCASNDTLSEIPSEIPSMIMASNPHYVMHEVLVAHYGMTLRGGPTSVSV